MVQGIFVFLDDDIDKATFSFVWLKIAASFKSSVFPQLRKVFLPTETPEHILSSEIFLEPGPVQLNLIIDDEKNSQSMQLLCNLLTKHCATVKNLFIMGQRSPARIYIDNFPHLSSSLSILRNPQKLEIPATLISEGVIYALGHLPHLSELDLDFTQPQGSFIPEGNRQIFPIMGDLRSSERNLFPALKSLTASGSEVTFQSILSCMDEGLLRSLDFTVMFLPAIDPEPPFFPRTLRGLTSVQLYWGAFGTSSSEFRPSSAALGHLHGLTELSRLVLTFTRCNSVTNEELLESVSHWPNLAELMMNYSHYHEADRPRLTVDVIGQLLLKCPRLAQLALPFDHGVGQISTATEDMLPGVPITSTQLREFSLCLNWSFIHPCEDIEWIESVVFSLLSVLPFNCKMLDEKNYGVLTECSKVDHEIFEEVTALQKQNLVTINRHLRLRYKQWSLLHDYFSSNVNCVTSLDL